MFTLEICANSFASALAAEKGGAQRVELCENMAEGGTTPSYGQIWQCKKQLNLAVWPIIRPRGGDFFYSDEEFEIMKTDIQMCKDLQCDGAVTGILLANGEIDQKRCQILLELAYPMPVSFHRAFDKCNDQPKALEALIALGFVRVLTSGAAKTAYAGMQRIKQLIAQAGNRIEIMPGSGISPDNIVEIKNSTNATIFHASAKTRVDSKIQFSNFTPEEDHYEQTSTTIVKELTNKLQP
ncbi:MAG: copper homeostasis protein CutC [Pedobacter sp.]|nr:copper homeostasis protein CutC [Pedobacter sp.]